MVWSRGDGLGSSLGTCGRGLASRSRSGTPSRLRWLSPVTLIRTFVTVATYTFPPGSPSVSVALSGRTLRSQGILSTMNLSSTRLLKPIHALFLGGVALVAAGCGAGGPSFQPVSGKLTIEGKVPENVQISFYPVDGKGPIASGTVDAGTGRYELTSSGGVGKPAAKGAVVGKYKVVLNAGSGAGAASTEAMMAQYSGGDGSKGKAPATPKASFKKEYGSASTSPKEVEVKSGANAIDLDL